MIVLSSDWRRVLIVMIMQSCDWMNKDVCFFKNCAIDHVDVFIILVSLNTNYWNMQQNNDTYEGFSQCSFSGRIKL